MNPLELNLPQKQPNLRRTVSARQEIGMKAMEITFKKMTEAELGTFIKMRITTHHLVATRIIIPYILYFRKEIIFILSA